MEVLLYIIINMELESLWFEVINPENFCDKRVKELINDAIKEFEDALHVAEEHFAFCPDSVFQGAETINSLSSLIIESSIWDFWWD